MCFAFQTKATHIIGGELSYKYLGSKVYEITLKMYRDCYNGVPPFDNPTYITFYRKSDGAYMGIVAINNPVAVQLPLLSPDSCKAPPGNVCVEEAVMTTRVILEYEKEGYVLAYQRCCRNQTINNIIDPGYSGATYWTNLEMDSTVALNNSSPSFKRFPPIFICNNFPLKFDHSAIDIDGDSLVYDLNAPFLGGDTTRFGIYPVPAASPPYKNVVFENGYSINNQLGGNPPMAIDPVTGVLTAFPNQIGQYVVGVNVKEYRNGKLIAIHYRDFQFNVVDCLDKPKATVPEVILLCKSDFNVQFINKSIGAAFYSWNFGDPTTDQDTSSKYAPSYTYPGVGFYTATLISNPGLYCADTATTQVKVYNTVTGADFSIANSCLNDSVTLFSNSVLSEGNTIKHKWIFNNNYNDTLVGKSLKYKFNQTGTNFVKLVAYNENGCTDTLDRSVTIFPKPDLNFLGDSLVCVRNPTQLLVFGADNYSWSPTFPLSCNTCNNPVATVSQTTKFKVIGSNSFGCRDSAFFTLKVRPTSIPEVDIIVNQERCAPAQLNFLGKYKNFDSTCITARDWLWDFGDGNISTKFNPSHTYTKEGEYFVSVKFNNSDIKFQKVTLLSPDSCLKNLYIPNTFTPNGDGINDILYVRGINIQSVKFRLFNRWGEEIFTTDNINKGWDGVYKGQKLTPQVFVYTAEVTFWDGESVHKEGNITLVE